jgi:hypothetical protein
MLTDDSYNKQYRAELIKPTFLLRNFYFYKSSAVIIVSLVVFCEECVT